VRGSPGCRRWSTWDPGTAGRTRSSSPQVWPGGGPGGILRPKGYGADRGVGWRPGGVRGSVAGCSAATPGDLRRQPAAVGGVAGGDDGQRYGRPVYETMDLIIKPVVIRRGAWITTRCIVLQGVEVGRTRSSPPGVWCTARWMPAGSTAATRPGRSASGGRVGCPKDDSRASVRLTFAAGKRRIGTAARRYAEERLDREGILSRFETELARLAA